MASFAWTNGPTSKPALAAPVFIWHQDLGLGTFVVGLVAGAQFAASLLSRFWAGNYADSRGAKRALITGLLVAAAARLLYFLSLLFVDKPKISVTILLLGRGVLGAAESFIVTGAFSWGLALAGPQNTGKIMAWVGTVMYAAFAVAAPRRPDWLVVREVSQRFEFKGLKILPVQQPPTLVVGGLCMMRLTRILIFPFFPLGIMDQRLF